jgi:hypothetical protein
MSVEYIFFNEGLRDRFVAFIHTKGVMSQVRDDEVEGFVVRVPEEIDDAVSDAIEEEYDALMHEQILLAENDESWATRQVMGVEIRLADGKSCMVRIDGAIGRRLSEHFSPEEIHELVSAIAQSIENPAEGPLCRKV